MNGSLAPCCSKCTLSRTPLWNPSNLLVLQSVIYLGQINLVRQNLLVHRTKLMQTRTNLENPLHVNSKSFEIREH